MSFVHLHCHSDYSMLDGMATIKSYVKKCKSLDMKAIALTDHGNMHGVIEFYNACLKENIKPIIGCEFYHTKDRTSRNVDDKYNHLILLAMDEEGYHQLLKLSTMACTEGKWYKPRLDDRALLQHSSHLICLSACISGDIPKLILKNDKNGAKKRAAWYQEVFGDRFYIEVQNHQLPEEKIVTPVLIQIANELGIKIVATNDVHYIDKEDWDIHDTLLCIGTKMNKNDSHRLRYKEGEYYFRSETEMLELFPEHTEFVYNTAEVAERCNLHLVLPGPQLPKFTIPSPYKTEADYLSVLSYKGLLERFPLASSNYRKELEERLQHELSIIEKMDFSSYFLIVADYINWAKEHNIAVGPGRGSGAGSLVAYCIRITDVDPMKYNLLFERFLNPERVSLPDFDIDFCYERRGEVINYVSEKYGKDHVGQIVVFSDEKAKAALKDVARVFGISPKDANQLSSFVSETSIENKESSLREIVEKSSKLHELLSSKKYSKVISHAIAIEGLHRHTSLHAAGVVIGQKTLDEYVPLMTDAGGAIASQISSPAIEECGLVKMDFLGLKTLTVIRNTETLIKKRVPSFSIDEVPENDTQTFDMLSKGDSTCVFQFESAGMRDILKRTKPNSIEELAALNALYRPGPMQFIDDYIASKWDPSKIKYPDPLLEPILKTTYGVIVYQEQVMQTAQIIAGYSLGEADILRRIMGKKKKEELAQQLEIFTAKAIKNGHSKEHAEQIFHILEPFAGYGFNKSHAVAYSILAYKTAYLKAHYPIEFMAANLTNEVNNPDTFKEYISMAISNEIKIFPPSINSSMEDFSVVDNSIVYGLAAIKNIGYGMAKSIVDERVENGSYKSIYDFLKRQSVEVGKRLFEALVKSGCFDCFNIPQSVLLNNMEDVLKKERQRRKNEQNVNQLTLFDADAPDLTINFDEKENKPLSWLEKLKQEQEWLGVSLSGQPLDEYATMQDDSLVLSNPGSIRANLIVSFVAEVLDYSKKISKKNNPFGLLKLKLKTGPFDVFLFGKEFYSLGSSVLLEKGNVIGITGVFKETQQGAFRFVTMDICKPEQLSLVKSGEKK